MATDAAERQRRSRKHRAGDHSLCRPESLCAHPPVRIVPRNADLPAPPPDLHVDGRLFWDSMVAEYELEHEPGALALLEQACRVRDRLGVLDEALGSMMLDDSRTLALLKHSAELQRVFATLMAAMALPKPGQDEGEAKNLGQVMAAQARWRKTESA